MVQLLVPRWHHRDTNARSTYNKRKFCQALQPRCQSPCQDPAERVAAGLSASAAVAVYGRAVRILKSLLSVKKSARHLEATLSQEEELDKKPNYRWEFFSCLTTRSICQQPFLGCVNMRRGWRHLLILSRSTCDCCSRERESWNC